MRTALAICLFVCVLVQLVVCGPLNTRVKRQYGMGMGYRSGYSMGGMGGGLTPEQMIANRELAISQARTRQALVASEMATNQAVREAALINAESRLDAVESGMMMGGRGRYSGGII